ncbi:MAG: endonuclease/exonuclease/phosphatase family protein [Natronohydrobacter sp.]|nr:endonuclease/exonuclease/phosphatase family protein [Natronohydrobacter sp.]
MRIVTFNVQNLRLRRREGRMRFDGARDHDVPDDTTPEAIALDLADRRLTAAVLARADADMICLQEVFNLVTLEFFHDHLLRHAGGHSYPHRICLPGNDGGGRDLAVLSRRPLEDVRSHAELTPEMLGLPAPDGIRADTPIFRRDCLRFRVGELTLFHCHFKAPWPDLERAWPVRRMEALAVRKLVEHEFATDPGAHWMILGDLNEPSDIANAVPAIAPLLPPFAVDLLARMPSAERWTYYNAQDDHYACPDAVLASPALAQRWRDVVPRVLRAGLDRAAHRATETRLTDVGAHRPHASDHAAIVVDLDGLELG